MRLCPRCERPYEGDPDFCPSCGEYLRWAPTGFQQAVPEPAAPAPPPAPVAPPPGTPPPPAPPPVPPAPQAPAAPAPPDPVLLALRRPGDEGYATEPLRLSVVPGGSVEVVVLVRNQSGIVDNYDMSVDGMPADWWQIGPSTVYLVPYGSPQGSYEQEVTVRIAPPRTPEAEARPWDVSVVATSRADPSIRVAAGCGLDLEPYAELSTEISPERRGGRVQVRFDVVITNRANAPVDVALAAVDPEDALGFEFQRPATARAGVPLEPAQMAERGMRMAQRFGPDALDPAKMAARAAADLKAGGGARIMRRLARKKPAGPKVTGLRIGPGESADTVLLVNPPRQIWIGRSALRPFQVTPQPLDADTPSAPAGAAIVHRPWLPWWSAIVIPLLVVGAFWYLSMQASTVTVPDLRAASDAFAADGLLKEVGLVLEKPPTEVPAGEAEPGTIVDQVPLPGESVEKGATVAIKIAVAPEQVPVPDIAGKTAAEASGLLQAQGLQLGPPEGDAGDPATALIATQDPVAGAPAAKGSAVAVSFESAPAATGAATAPTAPGPTATAPGATTPAAGGTPAGGGKGTTPTPSAPVSVPATVPPKQPPPPPAPPAPEVRTVDNGARVVPNLALQDSSAAQASLSRAGLVPQVALRYDGGVAAGRVVAQEPVADTELPAGSPVSLVVSLGEPEVVYDNNNDLFRVSGVDGTQRTRLTQGPARETQASISRDGRLIAYRVQPDPDDASSAQIFVMDPADPASAHAVTNSGFNDRRPAISPDGSVVAFVSNRQEPDPAHGLNLCFVPADATEAAPDCSENPDVAVSRPTWSPDGRSIVVTATQGPQDAAPQLELLQYTSSTPSSATAGDWVEQGLVTDGLHGQSPGDRVFSAAFSPDGGRIAFTADWKGGVATVRVLPVTNGLIGDTPVALDRAQACEISWRPDGGELVVARRGSECRDKGQIGRVDLATQSFDPLTVAGAEAGAPVFVPVG